MREAEALLAGQEHGMRASASSARDNSGAVWFTLWPAYPGEVKVGGVPHTCPS